MPRRVLIPVLMSALLVPAWAAAQPAEPAQAEERSDRDRGDRGDRDRGDRGERGDRPDPAEFRQRMEQRMKEQLGVNDEEWKVLQPKLEKIMTLRRDSMSGGMGMVFGGGRRDESQQRSGAQQASGELRKTLENKDATPEEIASKLKSLREAREKSKAELTAAQKELKELLTQRQEAIFVTMGILE